MSYKKINLNIDNYMIVILVFVYFFLYFSNIFAVVDSVEFMSTDPSSIVGSINSLFVDPVYNMNGGYHSRVYGWTYFAENFFVLAPFKLLGADHVTVNIVIRFFLFVVGLGVVLAFFALLRRVVGSWLTFFLAFYFITNPVVASFFVTIHPETTGVFFYLVALFFLWRLYDRGYSGVSNYIVAVICLTLSALSKQPFAIISFFIFVGFLFLYIREEKPILKKLVSSLDFRKKLALTLSLVFMVSFFIHPYLYIDFKESLGYQLRPLSHSSGSVAGIVYPWGKVAIEHPIVILNFSLLMLLPYRKRLNLSDVFVYSLVVSVVLTLLFMVMQKRFITIRYIFPLYPFYILHVAYIVHVLYERTGRLVPGNKFRAGVVVLIGLVVFPSIFLNMTQSAYSVYKRVLLDGLTTKNVIWEYIQTLPEDVRVFYIPTVAVPDKYKAKGCHVWRNCSSYDRMARYNPDYIMVSWAYKHFDHEMVQKYINEKQYVLLKEVQSTSSVRRACGYKFSGSSLGSKFISVISPLASMRNADDCMKAIKGLVLARKNQEITGFDISVYIRHD